jgi:hypothetical protein
MTKIEINPKVLQEISKETLLKANEELRNRIEVLIEENMSLKKSEGELNIRLSEIQKELVKLAERLNHKETIIKNYQGSTKKITYKNNSSNKPKNSFRDKLVYGILQNKGKYKLSEKDIEFLNSLKNFKILSQKQNDWLEGIKKRVK